MGGGCLFWYDTPTRPVVVGQTKNWMQVFQEGFEDWTRRIRHRICEGINLVLRFSVISSSAEVSMLIVLAAFFVVQCHSQWSMNALITKQSVHTVTWDAMSHLWYRAPSGQVILEILHSDIYTYSFHYGTILLRVGMDFCIMALTLKSQDHGVRWLLLIRIISFAYLLDLWKVPFSFLFTYHRSFITVNAWIRISDCSLEVFWASFQEAIPILAIPQQIYDSSSELLANSWTWFWNMYSSMDQGGAINDTVPSSMSAIANIAVTVLQHKVTEIAIIIRTNIVMCCIMCLWGFWISAPNKNECARKMLYMYICSFKLPWLLSASNTRYMHVICVAVSLMVHYEIWSLNKAPHVRSHTPRSFFQMSIADTILALCIVFFGSVSRILQYFAPRRCNDLNRAPDLVLQLGSLSNGDFDVILLTVESQCVFGNIDPRHFHFSIFAFPMELNSCVKAILQVFAEPIRKLPPEAACICTA